MKSKMEESEKNHELLLQPDEYGEYYSGYIQQVKDSDLEMALLENQKSTLSLLQSLDEKSALYRYQEGKWSVKEVIGHVIDTERIFSYRALALARGESASLAGYDHNKYVNVAGFDRFSVIDLQNHYRISREYTLSLFGSFNRNELLKRGIVNGAAFTVRGLGYVIAGHELHHIGVLKEKYLR